MMLVELIVPKGALSEEHLRHLSERLVPELIAAEGAPAEMIERGRSMGWLVIHEPGVWTVAGQALQPDDAARYVVRLTVPGGHMSDGQRAEAITRITRVLSEIEEEPHRLYRVPHAWVHINELPDGNAGAFGQMMRTSDIMQLVMTGTVPEHASPSGDGAFDTLVDPICGMAVELIETAITLEHEGTIYAFCCDACRDIFAEQHVTAAH